MNREALGPVVPPAGHRARMPEARVAAHRAEARRLAADQTLDAEAADTTPSSGPPLHPKSAAPVNRAHPVLRDPKVSPEMPVPMGSMGRTQATARMDSPSPPPSKSLALSAPLEFKDHRVNRVQRVHPDQRVPEESHQRTESPESPDIRVSPVHQADPVAKDPEEHPARVDVSSPFPGLRPRLARQERPEDRDQRAHQARPETPTRVHPAHPESPASPDARVVPVVQEALAHQGPMETRAAATIAQSPELHRATSPEPEVAAVVVAAVQLAQQVVLVLATTASKRLLTLPPLQKEGGRMR